MIDDHRIAGRVKRSLHTNTTRNPEARQAGAAQGACCQFVTGVGHPGSAQGSEIGVARYLPGPTGPLKHSEAGSVHVVVPDAIDFVGHLQGPPHPKGVARLAGNNGVADGLVAHYGLISQVLIAVGPGAVRPLDFEVGGSPQSATDSPDFRASSHAVTSSVAVANWE